MGAKLFLRSTFRFSRRLLRTFKVRCVIFPVRFLLFFARPNFKLSNNTIKKIDGVGAQIQRLLGIYSLSKKLRIDFVQNPFLDISVHPLDPYQTQNQKVEFVKQLNFLFKVNSSSSCDLGQVIEIGVLTPWKLLSVVLRNFLKRGSIQLNVIEPYPITDSYPDLPTRLQESFPNWVSFAERLVSEFSHPIISIHYRQGVGGGVIYPGQKISRELPPSYFLLKLKSAYGEWKLNSPINLFTDAPVEDLTYSPDADQSHHWEGTPGFSNGQMKVRGNDLHSYFAENNLEVAVRVGGNPLEAIAIMSKSDLLITSRSSLSYVAGLLNSTGTIIAADGFWHPSPRMWVTT
jgi:hypothetical protein